MTSLILKALSNIVTDNIQKGKQGLKFDVNCP